MSAYLRAWHLLPLTVLFILSIILGGLLLRRLLVRAFADVDTGAQTPRRRRSKASVGSCMLAMLLALLGAGFAAAAIMALFHAIRTASPEMPLWPYLVGGPLALVAMLVVAYLILLAMYPLPAGRMLGVAGPVALLVLVIAVVISAPTGFFAYRQKVMRDDQTVTLRQNLTIIDRALREYEVRNNVPAPSLEALVEREYIERQYLQSPARPEDDEEIAYFYMPKRSVTAGSDTSEIRVCDYRENFGGKGRGILLLNRGVRWVSEQEFQKLLELEENQDFAAALRAAEGD